MLRDVDEPYLHAVDPGRIVDGAEIGAHHLCEGDVGEAQPAADAGALDVVDDAELSALEGAGHVDPAPLQALDAAAGGGQEPVVLHPRDAAIDDAGDAQLRPHEITVEPPDDTDVGPV